MVFQQQVFFARRTARQRADDQLRGFARAFADPGAHFRGKLQPSGNRERKQHICTGIFSPFHLGRCAFFIYLISAYAETNRTPFDLPEAESELVAGYHTEYSAMKFAMFFMAEYSNMVTVACLSTLLFFGGWLRPGIRATDCAVTAARVLVLPESFLFYVSIRLGALDASTFPL